MNREKKILEQVALMEVIKNKANINIVTCGSCGSIMLHKRHTEDVECPYCDFKSDQCNFPDYYYEGMELSGEFKN